MNFYKISSVCTMLICSTLFNNSYSQHQVSDKTSLELDAKVSIRHNLKKMKPLDKLLKTPNLESNSLDYNAKIGSPDGKSFVAFYDRYSGDVDPSFRSY